MHEGISNEDYHADRTCLSSSMLKALYEDVYTYHKRYIENDDSFKKDTPSLRLGSYIHTLLLEPDRKSKDYVIYAGQRRGNIWADFKLDNPNKVIISPGDVALGMELIKNKPLILDSFLSNGVAETTAVSKIDGILFKARPDYFNPIKNYIVDVKTTSENLSMDSLKQVVIKWDYDLSAALYCNVVKEITGKDPDFYFAFVCKNPISTRIIKAGESVLASGNEKIRKALQNYRVYSKMIKGDKTPDNEIKTLEFSNEIR